MDSYPQYLQGESLLTVGDAAAYGVNSRGTTCSSALRLEEQPTALSLRARTHSMTSLNACVRSRGARRKVSMSSRSYYRCAVSTSLVAILWCIAPVLTQEKDSSRAAWVAPESLVLLDVLRSEVHGGNHDLARFRSPEYVNAFLGQGLLHADPQTLLTAATEASQRGEHYKALYLARLTTMVRPDLDAAVRLRQQTAVGLGVAGDLSRTPQVEADVVLPGVPLVRPTTLRDWAAAVLLVQQDVVAIEGKHATVAIPSGVSGTNYLFYEKPALLPQPTRVDHVLPNLFVLRDGEPMKRRGTGGLAALMLGVAAATAGAAVAAPAYADGLVASSRAMLDASARANEAAVREAATWPTLLEGGVFTRRTYSRDGTSVDVQANPTPAGEDDALYLPVALPWASGSPFMPVHEVEVWTRGGLNRSENSLGAEDKKKALNPKRKGDGWYRTYDDSKPSWSQIRNLPDRAIAPKLLSLCEVERREAEEVHPRGYFACGTHSQAFTLTEILLEWREAAALFPGLTLRALALEPFERLYIGRPDRLAIDETFAYLLDSRDMAYSRVTTEYDRWVLPVGGRKSKR